MNTLEQAENLVAEAFKLNREIGKLLIAAIRGQGDFERINRIMEKAHNRYDRRKSKRDDMRWPQRVQQRAKMERNGWL